MQPNNVMILEEERPGTEDDLEWSTLHCGLEASLDDKENQEAKEPLDVPLCIMYGMLTIAILASFVIMVHKFLTGH